MRRTALLAGALLALCFTLAACDTADPTYEAGLDAAARPDGAGMAKVSVCHYDADAGTYHLIVIAAPAVAAHLAQGGGIPGGAVPGQAGYIFDADCQPIPDPLGGLPNRVTVDPPSAAAGVYGATGAAFGPSLTIAAISGSFALVNDGTASPTQGCSPLIGFPAGAIAIVDRGACLFIQKVLNAQNAGAVAVVVVNSLSGLPVTMGGDDPTITIPAVMVSLEDGTQIKGGLPASGSVSRNP
jgi:hypothetical protein